MDIPLLGLIYLPISGVEIMAWKLILLGFTVGVIGGFFGVGGAFMVTPALNVFGFPMAYAIGTDMAHIAGKSIVATAKHRKYGNVDMRLGVLMIIGTAIGIEGGATTIMWLEKVGRVDFVVRITYMVLLFGLSSYMFYEYYKLTHGATDKTKPVSDAGTSGLALKMQSLKIPPMIHLKVSGFTISVWVILIVSAFTGYLAGFLGVGGGFIRMPSLMYVIGCPTRVAVGTDLFEIVVTGAYGAFTYALRGRVELIAATVMLIGAAVGAQFGTLATQYVKGLKIRLYFASTMGLAGISVIFKHIAGDYKSTYSSLLNAWVKDNPTFIEWAKTEGAILSAKVQVRDWILMNKDAVKGWFVQQSEAIQQAKAMETMWNNYSGYLMLGSAVGLSILIIAQMLKGVKMEKALLKARTIGG
ncbi:MAG: sulfite exporter TauE/SafE family protein [Syntrophaceae bacterium]|nr:sulfite exporter TauE/SafE family protein [Syntrophaceae bacterium]NTW66420.1 sulfite exporter TauE/SafE family protein [Nitrospirota bacterium]